MKDQDLRDNIQSVFLGNSLEKLREEILDSFFKILSATDPTKDIKGAEFIEEKIPKISKVYSAQKNLLTINFENMRFNKHQKKHLRRRLKFLKLKKEFL